MMVASESRVNCSRARSTSACATVRLASCKALSAPRSRANTRTSSFSWVAAIRTASAKRASSVKTRRTPDSRRMLPIWVSEEVS